MPDFLLQAAGQVLSFHVLGLIVIGTLLGIVGGAIPGFTVTMAILVVFPFTFTIDPVAGVALMTSVFVGGYSGGLISGVMLGIPGTPSSITTVYDGRPMAVNGEPGRALGIGFAASFIGTIISVIILVLFGPLIARFSINFRPWEITGLVVLALTLVASLSAGQLLKGLIAAVIGLLLTTVGYDSNSNLRLDFGFISLQSGLSMLPILIGAFAFPQTFQGLETSALKTDEENVASTNVEIPYRQIMHDLLNEKFNLLRSSVLGALIGALPGAGGTIANFISYDQAKKASKHPEDFGTGIPSGIIASEASNSAVPGGAFIPTLALGIPGDLPMSLMLGVLILHGMNPGPLLFQENPILIGSIYIAMLVSAVVMLVANLGLVRWSVRIAMVPDAVLAPIVLIFCAVGSFALNNNVFDIWVLLGAGLLGYVFARCNVPLTPLILGVVLGKTLEEQLFRGLQLEPSWTEFFTRPISGTLFGLAAACMVFSLVQNARQQKRVLEKLEAAKPMRK
jgi:putative tricarboxylic transport membrane protein